MGKLKILFGPKVGGLPPVDQLVGPGSGIGGTNYPFAPLVYDRELHRTVLVTADEAAIDLQSEVAHPGSPTVAEWTVSGPTVALWTLDAGKLKPKAGVLEGTTHSLTIRGSNLYGASVIAVLTVIIPLNANCRFCDFANGVDAGVGRGLTPAAAWKQMPRSSGFTGTQVTLGAGIVVFFRGGVSHRYALTQTFSPLFSALPHQGVDGNKFVYSFSGWGGRAIMDGTELLASSSTVTQAEVDGNPNWANLRKISLGTAANIWNHLFNGAEMLYAAQSPQPTSLKVFEGPQDSSGAQGMFQVATTTSAGVSPRINLTSTNVITLVDARLNDLIGPVADPTGRYIPYWVSADIGVAKITNWDAATSTLTATSTIAPRSTTSAWCLQLLPYSIAVPGQYALSADGLTAYYWPVNSDDVSIGRLARAMTVGGVSHLLVAGGVWRGYCSPTGAGGNVFANSGASCTGISIVDHEIKHNRAEGGDALVAGSGSTGIYWDKTIFERLHFSDMNPKSGGIKIGNEFRAVTGGSPADVRASLTGKVRYCYFSSNSLMRTGVYFSQADGVHIHSSIMRDLTSLHGNGVSLYDQTIDDGGYSRNFVIENNLFDNVVRGFTVSMAGSAVNDLDLDRNNLITRNILLGNSNDQGFVMALYKGEPGSTVSQNIIMGATGWDYPQALSIAVGSRVKLLNNVVAGVSRDGTLANCTYTSQDNLYTVNAMLPDDGPTRVSSGDTLMSGAPVKTWDRTISAAMAATLGPGPIGLFWNVAA